jgi:uncharacterized membrane protein YphA (DoxX/SURF4 family)
MIRSVRPGQLLLAAALALFGVQYLLAASPVAGPAVGPPLPSGGPLASWILGGALLAAGVCIGTGKLARWVAALTGIALSLRALIVYGAEIVAKPRGPQAWTGCFELLAIGAGAWTLAGALAEEPPASGVWRSTAASLPVVSRLLFAVSLPVFGVQHLHFAKFVATLVPGWLPARLFWAIFFGVAFIAAGVSLAIRVKERLAATLLGAMFLLWFLVLHLPRSFAAPLNGNEWTSGFVALAMAGSAWILAGAAPLARISHAGSSRGAANGPDRAQRRRQARFRCRSRSGMRNAG